METRAIDAFERVIFSRFGIEIARLPKEGGAAILCKRSRRVVVLSTLILCVVLASTGYASSQCVPVPKEAVSVQKLQLAAPHAPPSVHPQREIEVKTLELKSMKPAKTTSKPVIVAKPKAAGESAVPPSSTPAPNQEATVTLVGRGNQVKEVYSDGEVNHLKENELNHINAPNPKGDAGQKKPEKRNMVEESVDRVIREHSGDPGSRELYNTKAKRDALKKWMLDSYGKDWNKKKDE